MGKKDYDQGRKRGQKEGFVDSVMRDVFSMVNPLHGATKSGKDYNRGIEQGRKDRRQGYPNKKLF